MKFLLVLCLLPVSTIPQQVIGCARRVQHTKSVIFFQLAIRAQESSEEPLLGSLGSPDGAPEARFGGHGKHHKVLTTGEHPIDEQHDYSHAKPNPGTHQ